MPKISAYEVESEKETPSGVKRKYKSGTLSKEDGKADLMISSDDRPNLYKYGDEKAAQKDYELFKSEAEMGMRKGGYVRAADGIAKRGKTRGKIV
jgi:hypothetical protein